MAKLKTILPEPKKIKLNRQYNLARGRVAYAKRLGGYSWTDLALFYEKPEKMVKRWCAVYKRYVEAGLVELPEAINKEPLK